ncbi:MAG: hypothetical protein J3R72DRAFT_43252 [Linnemannia gamsii]|nr:MAG: hypothetical protein J3R72DRAFT_43252 [Linnemannia gamsii]
MRPQGGDSRRPTPITTTTTTTLLPKPLIQSIPPFDALQNRSCHRRHLFLVHLGTPWYTVRVFFVSRLAITLFSVFDFLVALGFTYITSRLPWSMSTPTQPTTAPTDTSSDTQAIGQRSSRDDPPPDPSSTPHQTKSSTSISTSTSRGREAV